MAGDKSTEFAEAMRKDMKKMDETLPSMTEMVRNEAEASGYTERYKKTFGVDEYHVPDSAHVLGRYSAQEAAGLNRERRHIQDLSLRASLMGQNGIFRSKSKDAAKKESEREIAFRTKEESYKKKESEQEKAAKQRNEAFSKKATTELEAEAEELRADLSQKIDEDDSYQVGYREYQKQYLAAVEDLIATRAQEGKRFGNYSSHIALAEEKYRFYSEEGDRIIGREQAKVLMSRERFEDAKDVYGMNHPMPEFDLTRTDSFRLSQDALSGLSPSELNTVKKAMKEYRECSERAYELQKQIWSLERVFGEEEDKKNAAFKAVEEDPEVVVTEKMLRAHLASAGPELNKYIESLRTELRALCFHADAGVLCIKHILDLTSDDHMYGMNVYGDEEDTLSAHAGYIESHYGVKINAIDTKAKLRGQEIAKRIGLDTVDSDISGFVHTLPKDSELSVYFRNKWANRSRDAATGYAAQDGYERTAVEAANFGVIDLLSKEDSLEDLTAKQAAEAVEKYVDVAVLLQPLPDVRMVRSEETGTLIQSMSFSGSRNAQGEFISQEYRPETGGALKTKASEFRTHMKNRDTLIQEKDTDLVKEAIIGELPVVFEAFSDIDAFMNVGESKKIFTSKSHEDVFRYTAGMPTFERKVRQVRDLLSLMLERGDLVDTVGEESGVDDLRKTLFEKWLFTNRVLYYVDYRRQVMEKGYDSTMEEWSEDSLVVENFWERALQAAPDLISAKWSFLAVKKDKAKADSEEEDEEDDDEEDEEEAEAAVSYSAMIEKWEAELDEVQAEVLERRQQFDSIVDGMTRNEKHFIRMGYYESPVFKTRSQQEGAIRLDLYRGTEFSTCDAAHLALVEEIDRVRGQLKDNPSKALRDRLTSLEEQKAAVIMHKGEIAAQVDERAKKLLQLVKRPATVEQGIDEVMGVLYCIVLSEKNLCSVKRPERSLNGRLR